jgi:hypothetical protein
MLFKDKLIEVCDHLESNNIILLPTDHEWTLACKYNGEAIQKLNDYRHLCTNEVCIIFEDLNKLAGFKPRIHPRVETLLIYLERSFKVQPNRPALDTTINDIMGSDIEIYLQYPKSLFVRHLLSLLPYPLVTCRSKAYLEQGIFLHKDLLPIEYLSVATYQCLEEDYIDPTSESVVFTYDHEGNLIFLGSESYI